MWVLVAEDEPRLSKLLARVLTSDGHHVDVARDGEAVLAQARHNDYDALILDVMLPSLDGVGVCRNLRQGGSMTPILMLTARTALDDRVRGLDAGADDYLTKPFEVEELFARLRAITRRHLQMPGPELSVGDLHLNPATHVAAIGDTTLDLSVTEFALLEALLRAERTLSRVQLLDKVWRGSESSPKIVDVYVHYLRRKLKEAGGDPKLLRTVRGVGYAIRR